MRLRLCSLLGRSSCGSGLLLSMLSWGGGVCRSFTSLRLFVGRFLLGGSLLMVSRFDIERRSGNDYYIFVLLRKMLFYFLNWHHYKGILDGMSKSMPVKACKVIIRGSLLPSVFMVSVHVRVLVFLIPETLLKIMIEG